ncbi:unnamed protein product [Spirodela intermedia]|uniref:ABC transporter domain-containing protein n=1 Tax=Spirodela intermedia TaxID=51605 RepID=A0A7I8J6H8_SPIIN|nr:unnamed protein product [Spirodela intermedia]CAA6665848.1 unnamed protein product [Spirodela intermedia]
MELPVKSPAGPGWQTRYRIEAKSLSYRLPAGGGKFSWSKIHASSASILKDVSCDARPGEVLAIVGPSGAGKTTLLSILAGMNLPGKVAGEIQINGCDMEASIFQRVSGYVTQEDALFPLLTVEESLLYSARLRLHRRGGGELGLEGVAKSTVGSGGGRGISGGERRRLSIGVDLVHDPAILLLDEPTSGLDSAAALQIMSLLKFMAKAQGKTVVLTIHQPGFRILELFDRVLLLAEGTVRHHGSLSLLEKRLEEAGHRVPHHVNVLEYAMDAMTSSNGEMMAQSNSEETPHRPGGKEEHRAVIYANSPPEEVLILGERFFKNILRTNQLFAAKIIQSLVAGVGLGTIFMNVKDLQSRVGFFAFTLTFLLSSTTEALPVFLRERRILMRETSSGAYRVSSYVLANALVFLPFLLAVALLFVIDGFLYFSLVVWMVVAMANSFVTCFSALVPSFIMGNSLISGLIGSFFLFSGYFISKDSIPKYWIFMHYLSLFKYPFEAFMINEYGGGTGRKACLQRQGEICVLDGEMFLRQQGFYDHQRWTSLG